jgi:hypothetical protein
MKPPVDPQRDRQETIDAFVIVMGMSFFPLISATVGFLLIHFGAIPVPDYNPTATTVKGLGRGLFVVTWFGIAGLIVPFCYAVHVVRRNWLLRREDERKRTGAGGE